MTKCEVLILNGKHYSSLTILQSVFCEIKVNKMENVSCIVKVGKYSKGLGCNRFCKRVNSIL